MKTKIADAAFGLAIILMVVSTIAMFARVRGHIAATQAYIHEMNRE